MTRIGLWPQPTTHHDEWGANTVEGTDANPTADFLLGPGGLTLPRQQCKYGWAFTWPPLPHVSAEQVIHTLPLRCLPGTYLKSTVNAHIFLLCPLHGAQTARTAFTAITLTSSTMLAHMRPTVWIPSGASTHQRWLRSSLVFLFSI